MEETKSVAALYAELGEVLFRAGRHKDAAEVLKKALAEGGSDFYLEQVNKTLREVEEALASSTPEEILTAVEKAPWSWTKRLSEFCARKLLPGFVSPANQLLRKVAQGWLAKGRLEDAEALLKILLMTSPEDSETQEAMGWTLLRQGKVEQSVSAFKRATEFGTHRASAFRGLGEAYNLRGQAREAVGALTRSLQLEPEQIKVLMLHGLVLRGLGNLEESAKSLEHAVRLDPQNCGALEELALTQAKAGEHTLAAQTLSCAAELLCGKKEYKDSERLARLAIEFDGKNSSALFTLGWSLLEQKQVDEAEEALDRAAQLQSSVRIDQLRAWGKYLKGDWVTSIELAERVLQSEPNSARSLVLKAAALNHLGRKDEASAILSPELVDKSKEWLVALSEAIQHSPEPFLFLQRGDALFRAGELKEALDCFEAVLAAEPDNVKAIRLRGYTLGRLGEYEKAIVALQLALDLDGSEGRKEDFGTLVELAEGLRLIGRSREAKAAFKKLLADTPDNAWVLARYGETLRALAVSGPLSAQGAQLQKAIGALERSVKLDPNSGWTWGALGAAYFNKAKYRSALAALNRALVFDPRDAWSMAFKGLVFRFNGRFDEAIEVYTEAFGLDGGMTWVAGEKATALRMKKGGDLREAVALLKTITDAEPKNLAGWTQLTICLYLDGSYEEAEKALQKALSFDPSNDWTQGLCGLILDKRGLVADAAAAHQQALGEQKAESYVKRGIYYVEFRAYDRAIEDFEQAMALDSNSFEAYNALAWLYADTLERNFDQAVALARKSVALATVKDEVTQASAIDTLGWSLYKSGKPAEALEHINKGRQMDPENLQIEDHAAACQATLARM